VKAGKRRFKNVTQTADMEVSQEESEHNEVGGMKKGVDLNKQTGEQRTK